MRFWIFALSCCLAGAPQSLAQTAKVTFYSAGSRTKMFAPHSDQAAFYGFLFDGKAKLAALEHGRFATFMLPVGTHTFSASYSRHPARNSQLVLNLAEGSSYYVSVEAHVVNFYYPAVQLQRGILTEVDCEVAQKEAGDAQPIELKRVAKDLRQELDPATHIPACIP